MTTITFQGKQYPCLEHMKEIKKTSNGELFNKYYNKKQMFKDLVGKVRRRYEDDDETQEFDIDPEGYVSEFDAYGKISGQRIHSGSVDWTIELYKLKNIEDDISDKMQWNSSFFVKDDSGEIWWIYTDID